MALQKGLMGYQQFGGVFAQADGTGYAGRTHCVTGHLPLNRFRGAKPQ